MNLPWGTAARWAGGSFGVILGIAALFTLSSAAKGGLSCRVDSVWVPGPRDTVATPTAFTGAVDSLRPQADPTLHERLDSLIAANWQKDSAFAALLMRLQDPVTDEWHWRVEADSFVVIGMARWEWCPMNGAVSRSVAVDSLITPTHILRITETVMVTTGIEWYWLPVVAVVTWIIVELAHL